MTRIKINNRNFELDPMTGKVYEIRYSLHKICLLIIAICLILVTVKAYAEDFTIDDGIPDPNGQFSYSNVVYMDRFNNLTSEYFRFPLLTRDFGEVGYIAESPLDPSRTLDSIPSFGLAKWHWWLFGFEVLPRVQRTYSDCVGQIKALQKLLRKTPLYDDPKSPTFSEVVATREYMVPFEPIQYYAGANVNLPPRREDAIAEARAAIASVNAGVYMVGKCKTDLYWLEQEAKRRITVKK